MKLVIDKNSISKRRSKVTGRIAFQEGDYQFPEPNYSDFVFTLVVEFSEKVSKMLRGNSSKEELLFMEGPYQVDITKEGDSFKVQFKEEFRNWVVQREKILCKNELFDEWRNALETCIEVASNSDWGSEYLDDLKYVKSVLEQAFKS